MDVCNGRKPRITIDSGQWDFVVPYPDGWEEIDRAGWIRIGDSYWPAIQANAIRWNSKYGKEATPSKGEKAADSTEE